MGVVPGKQGGNSSLDVHFLPVFKLCLALLFFALYTFLGFFQSCSDSSPQKKSWSSGFKPLGFSQSLGLFRVPKILQSGASDLKE